MSRKAPSFLSEMYAKQLGDAKAALDKAKDEVGPLDASVRTHAPIAALGALPVLGAVGGSLGYNFVSNGGLDLPGKALTWAARLPRRAYDHVWDYDKESASAKEERLKEEAAATARWRRARLAC